MLPPQLKKAIDDIWDTFATTIINTPSVCLSQLASSSNMDDICEAAKYNECKCIEIENRLNPNGEPYLETDKIQQRNICEAFRDQINTEIAKLSHSSPR